ncbi:MAG TPA: aldo/keto reductase [Steroidobacteraceae bacterium]|jgi:aryl-alcohol dehydrogenase-like predicted oxidoreductase|nr:aldo/keto reductase [Steroidobacteraceae bacterium]
MADSPQTATIPRPLGRSGLKTLPLALGGNVFGWTADEKSSFEVLDRFVDAGFSLIDTADVYSKWVPGHVGGESETILGRWLGSRGNRARVLLATKAGGEIVPGRKGLSAAHIKWAVEESLRRLQTDYIDLYQAHYDDPTVSFEETLRAFGDLIAAGKVRAIGVSNHDPQRLQAALDAGKPHGLPRYETLQPLYNLYDRQDFEQKLAPICRAEGIGVINYYSLASGFLTGKYRTEQDVSASARQRSNRKYMTGRGFRILDALDAVAARTGAKQAQIAIAWLVSRPDVTAPIVSATSAAQMEEIIAAARLSLDREALDGLDTASAYDAERP